MRFQAPFCESLALYLVAEIHRQPHRLQSVVFHRLMDGQGRKQKHVPGLKVCTNPATALDLLTENSGAVSGTEVELQGQQAKLVRPLQNSE